jgi:hypothetical protein
LLNKEDCRDRGSQVPALVAVLLSKEDCRVVGRVIEWVPVSVVDLISTASAVPEANITSAVRLGVVLHDRRNLKVFPACYGSSVWYP